MIDGRTIRRKEKGGKNIKKGKMKIMIRGPGGERKKKRRKERKKRRMRKIF